MAQRDVVVGVFHREDLSTGLVGIHRAGFGPHARVLDSARGRLDLQLRKAGHRLPVTFGDDTDSVLILIFAPGRAALAAETLARAGAQAVHLVERADSRAETPTETGAPEPAATMTNDTPPADARSL